MNNEYFGLYAQAVLEMYENGEYDVDSNPEKAVVEQLMKKLNQLKAESKDGE